MEDLKRLREEWEKFLKVKGIISDQERRVNTPLEEISSKKEILNKLIKCREKLITDKKEEVAYKSISSTKAFQFYEIIQIEADIIDLTEGKLYPTSKKDATMIKNFLREHEPSDLRNICADYKILNYTTQFPAFIYYLRRFLISPDLTQKGKLKYILKKAKNKEQIDTSEMNKEIKNTNPIVPPLYSLGLVNFIYKKREGSYIFSIDIEKMSWFWDLDKL